MRALTELLTVFVAAFFGFFALVASLIETAVGFFLIAVAGFFSTVSLLIALFAGVMFAFTGNHHDGVLAVGYSLYAAQPPSRWWLWLSTTETSCATPWPSDRESVRNGHLEGNTKAL